MKIGTVVQFNENHKWCGCFGIIEEVKPCGDDTKYLIGVPVPQQVTAYAYIFVMESENAIEYIGEAIMMPQESEDEDE